MKDQNITLLQTADSDFDGVDWITIKKPFKIPNKGEAVPKKNKKNCPGPGSNPESLGLSR